MANSYPMLVSNPEYQVKNQEQALENVSGLVKNKFFKNGKEALEYAENQKKIRALTQQETKPLNTQ